jgi:hypothetical protein
VVKLTVTIEEWTRQRDQLATLIAKLDMLRSELTACNRELAEASRDRELLAQAMCNTGPFLDWLIDQDVSSAHMRKPSGPKGAQVEGRSDLELALDYCNWLAARRNAG